MLDKKDLEKVFTTYKDPLYGFILARVRHPQDAEDLLSRAFLKFLRFAEKETVRLETIKAFLFQITANTLRDHFRRRKIIQFISLEGLQEKSGDALPYAHFNPEKIPEGIRLIDAKTCLKEVNQLVETLPPLQKEAFYLRFMENFSFKEIAQIQGTTINTALSRVRYAVLKIKEALPKEWKET